MDLLRNLGAYLPDWTWLLLFVAGIAVVMAFLWGLQLLTRNTIHVRPTRPFPQASFGKRLKWAFKKVQEKSWPSKLPVTPGADEGVVVGHPSFYWLVLTALAL